jgi:hypothetical protein
MATKKRKRFSEGGITESEDKARGLESSKADKVGFLERLRMGNIDDEGSEAYRRFGAGRAKADRDMANEAAAMRMVDESRAAASPAKESAKESAKEAVMNSLLAAGAAEGMRKDTGDASVAEMYSGPRTKPIERTQPAKTKPASTKDKPASGKTSAYPMTKAQPTTKTYDRSGGPTADELASYRSKKPLVDQIPGQSNTRPVTGEKVEPMSDTERNVAKILAGTGAGAGALGTAYKIKKTLDANKAARAAAAKKRANLKRDVEEGIDRNLADELKNYSASAAEKAIANKQRADKTLNPNAWLAGPKNMADNFKRGGKVGSKPAVKKMASGGVVSNASKRADGIATKGKTRCKMR